jgi:hypothetical protein
MTLSYKQGLRIAEQFIRKKAERSSFSKYEFGRVSLHAENPRFWTFFCGSEQLLAEGHVPGGLFACVDKESGRIWTMDEVEEYYAAVAARAPQPVSRVA